MSQTLYRKYRPKNFSEVIGQRHIVETLSGALRNNRVAQAYLFTGPRGTGKTSIARILAKTVNCENPKDAVTCEKCKACQLINENQTLDIIEIDAASNTGVDNIRELRETVALPPTVLKYKIYIIDEVHMLSTGAFNALLKTLEEPPSHVIFILATTEIHKVPRTIISRCQRFDFARLPLPNIIEKLELIAKSEKVKIEKEALEMIAISAEGGMRDAESLLSQVMALEDKNITAKEVEEILGTADQKTVQEIATLILEKNSTEAISKVNQLVEEGYDLSIFLKALINTLRQIMLLSVTPELQKHFSYELTKEQIKILEEIAKRSELSHIILSINQLSEAQNKLGSFVLPQLPVEIAIIKSTGVFPEKNTEPSHSISVPQKVSGKIEISEKKSPEMKIEPTVEKNKASDISEDARIDLEDVRRNWKKLLTDIQPYNHSLAALLTNCKPLKTAGNQITLGTPYEFYKDKLEIPENRLTVEEVFGKILGLKIVLRIDVKKDLFPKKQEPVPEEALRENPSLLDNALEIMGGKVVTE